MDWMQRYDACASYVQKMVPGDVIRFTDSITFVPEALDKVHLYLTCLFCNYTVSVVSYFLMTM